MIRVIAALILGSAMVGAAAAGAPRSVSDDHSWMNQINRTIPVEGSYLFVGERGKDLCAGVLPNYWGYRLDFYTDGNEQRRARVFMPRLAANSGSINEPFKGFEQWDLWVDAANRLVLGIYDIERIVVRRDDSDGSLSRE